MYIRIHPQYYWYSPIVQVSVLCIIDIDNNNNTVIHNNVLQNNKYNNDNKYNDK